MNREQKELAVAILAAIDLQKGYVSDEDAVKSAIRIVEAAEAGVAARLAPPPPPKPETQAHLASHEAPAKRERRIVAPAARKP